MSYGDPYADTERSEEVPATVEKKPPEKVSYEKVETFIERINRQIKKMFIPKQPRAIKQVQDTEREYEKPTFPKPEPPPTPKFVLPEKRKPTSQPPVYTVDDTTREEEKIPVERKPLDREGARKFVETVIKAVGPRKRVARVDKTKFQRVARDTERKEEIPTTVEEKPVPKDRSAEVWTESEKAFRGVSDKLRTTAMGFREEGKRKQDLYSKTVYHTVGLGLRAGASAFDALTMPARPIFLTKTALMARKAISRPVESVGEFGKAIMEDPLGVTADIAGGFAGGSIAGEALKKVGIFKPSSYKLTQKTGYVTDISESPAVLMPKGTFRGRSWDPLQKGGTAVVQLEKHPGLASYWEPTPIYSPFTTTIPGLLGGFASLQGPDIDVVTKVDQQVKDILMVGRTPKHKIWVEPQVIPGVEEIPEEKIWVEPQLRIGPTPIITPIEIPTTRTRTRTKEIQEQVMDLGLITSISSVPDLVTQQRPRTRKIRVPRRRETFDDLKLISTSKLWGEKRRYPVATRKQLEKALFGK